MNINNLFAFYFGIIHDILFLSPTPLLQHKNQQFFNVLKFFVIYAHHCALVTVLRNGFNILAEFVHSNLDLNLEFSKDSNTNVHKGHRERNRNRKRFEKFRKTKFPKTKFFKINFSFFITTKHFFIFPSKSPPSHEISSPDTI